MSLERLVIDNIKRIRKEKGFTQEKLAEACGTATSYIGLMETYKNIPKLSTIEKIAQALSVEPVVFFKKLNELTTEQEEEMQKKKQRIITVLDKEIEKILRN